MIFQLDDLLKIVLAIVVGGLIGVEREFRDRAAGFRTLIFICVGATLFTIFSMKLGGNNDPTRIAANIVSGVGFLGAGVILREGGRVIGLTTASAIWFTAALGMGLGGGQYGLVGIALLLALIILWLFPHLEMWIDNIREERTYEIVCPLKPEKFRELETLFQQSELKIHSHRQVKSGPDMICQWQTSGSLLAHERVREKLFVDQEIKEFRF